MPGAAANRSRTGAKQNIHGEAFTVHAHQHGPARIDPAPHQRKMVRTVRQRTVMMQVEIP